MNRHGLARLPGLALIAIAVLAGGPSEGGEIPISLDAAVRMAVENNLGLRVETINPAISDTGVRRAAAIYDTRIVALLDHRGEDFRPFPGSEEVGRNRFFDANVSADRLLPTGATASVSFANLWSRRDGTAAFRFMEPEVSLSLSQPVLSGFGREVTERGITVATDAREASLAGWRAAALSVVADVRDAYLALVQAREDLSTRRASLAVAQRIHTENEARVRAGVLASIELLDSEFGAARRERELLEAEKNVLDQADRLRVLLQHPDHGPLVPAGTLPDTPVEASEEAAMNTAHRMRPDLAAARIELRTREFQARVSRNLALPSLAVTGSTGLAGLGTSYGNAIDDLAAGRTPFWSLGLGFSYPLGNEAARADLAEAGLRARQAQVSLRHLEEAAGLEIRSAIREMETKFREVGVAGKGVALGEARLASFLKRGKLGLATTKDILEVEADYAAAKDALTRARAEHQGAVTRYFRATGELLEHHGIRIEDREIETMAWKELR
jgi:outer membrane protein TolC